MTSLNTDLVQSSAQVQQHDQRMSDLERQLKDVTGGRSCGSGCASSAASSEPHPEPPPKNQRTELVVGGFPHDTERDVMSETLREIFGHQLGVKDWWTPGKVRSVKMVSFHTSSHVLTFLRKHKGRKFSHGAKQLWRSSERGNPALQESITGDQGPSILTNGAETGIDGDWERGRVWFKD